MVALTATATTLLQKHIIRTLSMVDPVIVEISPEKSNLYFSVVDCESVEIFFKPLMNELKSKRTTLD